MPIYELACDAGHRSETLQASIDPLPACPACGAATRKLPSGFGVGGTASVPPPAERMPQTWKGTHRGDRDYVTHLRRVADARRDLEARNPELAGDHRPVLAHEGRFEGSPLRADDPAPPRPAGADGAAGEGSAT
ncbi:MAG TPA: zinc ribbon domain-containing protein [Actinomycetota bacterium]|nr:zinc ribbon domain-containing protein [Actinomycetota bacterium]